jgi:tetratricopeptide (TPR) repeat protein
VPPDPRASCVRGLARAAGNRCREALADLESCTQGAADLRYVTALLGCRVELAQWRQAEEQVRALPAAFRQDRKVAALMLQVAKHPSATGAGSGGPPAAAAAGKSQTAAVLAPATAPGGSTPAAASAGAAARTPAAGTGGGASGAAPSGNVSGDPRSTGTAAAPQGAPATAAPPPPAASRPAAPMSAAERAAMARSESLLTATAMPDLREALRLARQLADAHPDSKEAQYLAGKAAYRNSRWTEAATYFRRGGPPADDHPELLFYMAVAYYEVGDRPGAAAALKRSLPNLQKTPFVESYVKRILGQ